MCACVGINNLVILLRARYKCNHTLLQIDDRTRQNKTLEELLRLATAGREVGRQDTVSGDRKGGGYLVLGDSILRNVETECSGMKLSAFRALDRHNCIELLKIET